MPPASALSLCRPRSADKAPIDSEQPSVEQAALHHGASALLVAASAQSFRKKWVASPHVNARTGSVHEVEGSTRRSSTIILPPIARTKEKQ